MNIPPYRNDKNIDIKGNTAPMSEKTFEEIQKEYVKALFDKVRQEVPSLGEFEPVYVVLEHPVTGDVYTMEVLPSSLYLDKRMLDLGVEIPQTENAVSSTLVKGTKQEILDYLGDERSLNNINNRFSSLKSRADEMD